VAVRLWMAVRQRSGMRLMRMRCVSFVRMRTVLLMRVGMCILVGSIVRMCVWLFMRMCRLVFVRMNRLIRRDHVHLGGSQTAAAHLAHLQPCAHLQRGSHLLQAGKGNAGIHQGSQQHIAADARKTLQISYFHR
jgi:hypothetical protein